MKKLLSYFLQGMLFIAPVAITIYVVYSLFVSLDDTVNDLVENVAGFRLRGLGFVLVIVLLTVVGYFSSNLFIRQIFNFFEDLMTRTPFIKILYTALKDLFSAVMSDRRKFNRPVLININKSTGLQKLGFITQNDLTGLGIKDKIAVYLPHSYAFSGNIFLINHSEVTPLEISTIDAMKFIVSGGVTNVELQAEKSEL